MATFVLVHGGAYLGWCFRPLARVLRESGHEVYTPTLTGLGERAHLFRADVDLDCHVNDVVAVLHYEDLRDVILVGHSYGGMVITGAADRSADRVVDGVEMCLFPSDETLPFYGVTDPHALAWMRQRLTPTPGGVSIN